MKSIMEAGLLGADDVSGLILWTNVFMYAQGYKVKQKKLYQDNKVLSYYRKTVKIVRLKVQYILAWYIFFCGSIRKIKFEDQVFPDWSYDHILYYQAVARWEISKISKQCFEY